MFSLDAVEGKLPRAIGAALCALLVLSSFALSQQESPSNTSDPDGYKISVNVGLVVLLVTVMNRKGEFVPNLAATDFRVSEAQQITLFIKAPGLGKLYVRTRAGYLIPPETEGAVSLAR